MSVVWQTSSNEHFRSQHLYGTSLNQLEVSESTQLRFRRCVASVCSIRLLCLHWHKYDYRYSPVSTRIFWYFSTILWKHHVTVQFLFFCRSDASWWPFAQTLGLHLWARSSGRPQTVYGMSEQWHRRVQAAFGNAHALLWLLTPPHHVTLIHRKWVFSVQVAQNSSDILLQCSCVAESLMTLKSTKNKHLSR